MLDAVGFGYVNEYATARAVLLPRFTRAVQRLRAAGIDVVVVRLPTTRALRHSLARQSTFEDDVRSLAAAAGADFVDGFALVDGTFTTDSDNFVDTNHLNARGSTVFSRALAEALARRPARQR
jgi:lysophospholipase L1-like esterase